MSIIIRAGALALLAITVAATAAQPSSHPGHWAGGAHPGFHHHHGGHAHWGFGVGIGFGSWPGYYPYYPYGPYPGYVLVEPVPPWYGTDVGAFPPMVPDPVFMPRYGQDATQTEADRQACNSWAVTQRDAVIDAAVFHRMVLACMEGRGYAIH